VPDTVDGTRFALDNGVSVVSATLQADQRTVYLVTTPQPVGTTLTLTVNGVADLSGNPIAPNSTILVAAPALPPAVVSNVGSLADGYELVYSLDIPIVSKFNSVSDPYYFNQSLSTGSFDRVAYYMELVSQNINILPPNNAVTQYVWTAMDAFTTSRKKIGVPTVASTAVFQQYVSNLVVKSNVSGVSNGTYVAGGNIEFWPSNYAEGNTANIPNASATTFDFGDSGGSSTAGHGCMQVHNWAAKQTVFAFNRWGSDNSTTEMGIGNQPSGNQDWTHAANANTYTRRTLHVMARPSAPRLPYDTDTTAPTLSSAFSSRALNKVVLAFSETLSERSAIEGSFALNNGVTVSRATLQSDKRSILLSTSPLTAGQTYQVTVSGVRDRSANGNVIAAGSTATFATPAAGIPSVLSNVPEIGSYDLIYQLAISNTTFYANGCNYTIDESRFGATQAFDRVAYCMELTGTNGVAKWVYVSMTAFTNDLSKIGVPTANRGAMFQQYVSNLNVYASLNVAGVSVTTGEGIPVGNIEFWPSTYGTSNDKNVSGANAFTYDFGDGGSPNGTTAGYGSMQIHNFAAGQSIMALNHFGSDNYVPAIGIGNNPVIGSDPDWTATLNASTYSVKNLYVLVHWNTLPPSQGAGPEIFVQPQSRTTFAGKNVSFYVQAAGATTYQWRCNGVWIPNATRSVLELAPAVRSNAGTYDVLVYSASGSYTVSQSATLSFLPPGTLLRLR
jgi:hypothetical protein